MLHLRTIHKLPLRPCVNAFFVNKLSTKPMKVEKEEEYDKQLKDFENLTHITRKQRTKKPQRPPFVKNLFVGVFDTEILTYPQLEKEDADALEQNTLQLNKFLQHNQIVDCKDFNKFFRQNLSDYKLLGLQASQFMGGRELNASESAQFLETLSKHPLHNNYNSNEFLGIQTILKNGSEALQKKYLPQLMNGSLLSAFCLQESNLLVANLMNTKAKLSQDKKSWVLNGEKCLVIDGFSADVYIVFATSQTGVDDYNRKHGKLTAFLVEKDFGGVTVKKEDDDSYVQFTSVKFEDTVVPAENIIGKEHEGEQVLKSVLNEMRLSRGPVLLALNKLLLNKTVQHVLNLPQDLINSELIATKLGELIVNLYAMESTIYLTTGLIDMYEDQDVELESALVKLFCAEKALQATEICMDLIGPASTLQSHWCNKLRRDIERSALVYESNDTLKMNISLMGIQHAGKELRETVRKLRNGLFYPWFFLLEEWEDRKQYDDEPKLNLNLFHDLHPSAVNASKHLEYCVYRLKFATKHLLSCEGLDALNRHDDLRRIADVAADCYAMTASIGRASRAYCTGIQSGDTEMIAAITFNHEAKLRVQSTVLRMYINDYSASTVHYTTLTKRLLKFKEYFYKTALHRNV